MLFTASSSSLAQAVLFSYSTRVHRPSNGPFHDGLGLPTSITKINKMPHRLAQNPVMEGFSPVRCPLPPDNFSLCQADVKPANTGCLYEPG